MARANAIGGLYPMKLFEGELVSIITPAFQAGAVIEATIKSVVAQTYPMWEMLIAEDCSTDNTREIVRKWALTDSRIRLIAMECNGGPSLARNAALEQASGRWIAFIDADDLWLPVKLERSLIYAQTNRAPLLFTGYRRMSEDGGHFGRYIGIPSSLSYHQLLGNTAIATSTVLIDRFLVGDFRMNNTFYDDFDCWLQILKSGHIAVGLNQELMHYRVMGKSISRNKKRSAGKVWRAYRDLEKLGLMQSSWYFFQYAFRGLIKYRNF